MSQVVEYILSLKDDLSKGLAGANEKAHALEGTMKGVGEMIGVLGISMAAFAGFEALKGAHEVWEKMEFSISQVEAGLKSTAGAAGLTMEDIQDSATKTAHSVKFAASEILGMQSVLLTFPSVTKESFQPATDIILDMSTRLGTDLKGSAIQVGKALQDPIKGITALRRVGVNFNEAQVKTIEHLAKTNQLAEAQSIILKELNLEFGGSAQAAAAADAGFRYEKSLEEIRLEVGHLVDKLQEELMPIALKFLEWVKSAVEWIKKNTDTIASLVKGIGAAVLIFKSITMVVIPFIEALTAVAPAAEAAAVGMGAAGASATAALGPLGLLAAAIGVVVTAYSMMSDAEEKATQDKKALMSKASDDAQEFIDLQAEEYEKSMKHDLAVAAARNYYMGQMDKKRWEVIDRMNKGEDEESMNVDKATLSYLNEAYDAASNYKENGLIKKKKPDAVKSGDVASVKDNTKSKATGSKSVTINVQIKDLIGVQNINTTNLKEGAGKIKDFVVSALTNAVNDFQIVAGH